MSDGTASGGERFEVVVVGAGPAGSAAALTLARAGVEVLVLERGDYPGAKNLFGGILYTSVLNELLPEFWAGAPIERHIINRRWATLDDDSQVRTRPQERALRCAAVQQHLHGAAREVRSLVRRASRGSRRDGDSRDQRGGLADAGQSHHRRGAPAAKTATSKPTA